MSGLATDVADRMAAAKLWLVSGATGDLPYLSTALYALVTVPTDRVATMATDVYWRIYVNPLWILGQDVRVVAHELAHQVWHLLADHAGRAHDAGVDVPGREPWKNATDITVDQVLPWRDTGLPSAGEMGFGPNLSAEEYYLRLKALPMPAQGADRDASCGSGCDGIARDYDLPPDDEQQSALSEQAAEGIRQTVAIGFREHQRERGTLPGQWDRWVSHILDPVVPWQSVLHAAVRRGIGWGQGQVDYTYSRVSRRQHAVGKAILPAMRRPVPAVAVVIDTSGSVDDGLLAQALGEVRAVLASLAVSDASVTVLAVDAAVQTVGQVRDVAAVRLGGGGGTDMREGIEAALGLKPSPQTVIVLTDGYTPWPHLPPRVPVIAAVLGRVREALPLTPDWAQRVEVVSGG